VQPEIELADRYSGEPGESSILVASDLCIAKPGTDLVLTGTVRPRKSERELDILFQVGSQRRTFRIFGPRFWRRTLGFSRISEPEPLKEVPLLWENAFGGADDTPSNEKDHGYDPAKESYSCRECLGRISATLDIHRCTLPGQGPLKATM
jgi:hypothetical protein